MTPHIDPGTPVREEEIEDDGGYFHTPVVTDTGNSSTPSSPPAPPRFTGRPYIGTHLILDLAHSNPLPAFWTPHRDGGLSSDDEVPIANLRYPVTLTSALLDITNTHWSDTEDDNDSDYDGDDESEDRDNETDLMVFMVESDENDPAPLTPVVAPLPQVEGDPTSFEEEAIEATGPNQELHVPEGNQEHSLDFMEDVAEIISSSEDEMGTEYQEDSSSNSSLDLTVRVQPPAVFHAEPGIRYSRRHSLHGFNKDDAPRREMLSMHRRHSMGEVAMVAV